MPIPMLQEQDIEQIVGHRNMRHGWEYFRSGALIETHRQDPVISASCIGSSRTPYQVEATFSEEGLSECRCSCPIGESGRCKHVAALLIAWQESPQSFVQVEPWDKAMSRCSRHDLVEIIFQLIEKRPELERTVEAMLPAPDSATEPAPPSVRPQVVERLDSAGRGATALAALAEQLRSIKDTGDQLVEQHESSAAADVYRSIVGEIVARPELLDARQPDLHLLLHDCIDGLGLCLYHLSEEFEERQRLLRTLLDTYRLEVLHGGVELGIDLPRMILAHVTREERLMVADWVRAMLPGIPDRGARRTLGGLLLELLGPQIDEAEMFDLCRRTDRIFDLVRRLVQSDRVGQALEEAPQADDDELAHIAGMLVRCRQEGPALRLIEQRLASGEHPGVRQWLDDHRARQAEAQAMLELSQKLFALHPTYVVYSQTRSLARQVGLWDKLRRQMIAAIERAKDLPLLVRVYLEENDVDRALEAVAGDEGLADAGGVALRVARAAERSRPLEALRLYQQLAERLVAQRGRDNLTEATRYLRKIRTLIRRTGTTRDWKTYLDDLRRRYRHLDVMYEELEGSVPPAVEEE